MNIEAIIELNNLREKRKEQIDFIYDLEKGNSLFDYLNR